MVSHGQEKEGFGETNEMVTSFKDSIKLFLPFSIKI
jgi:hypothetical protein